MEAARAAQEEKLENMKAAYEAHGGGIQGVAAAAVEGVKGYFTAGYTFLDNLTGGKLSAIREKFVSGVQGIASGVAERFEAVRTAFSNGIEGAKQLVTNAVTWFWESGKKVVTTFAEGITGAFSSAVDAVKGGLQRIRNFLPFSDAKEGPLSTLTLSGQRTMTTYASGLEKAANAPAQAMEKGLGAANNAIEKISLNPTIGPIEGNTAQTTDTERPKPSLAREPVKKVSLSNDEKGKDNSSSSSSDGNGTKQVIIQKLIMPVDLKKIKDLRLFIEVLKEIEDFANANGSEETADDPDAVPATT